MNLNYPHHSKFLKSCEAVIKNEKESLSEGQLISIYLPKGGYPRKAEIIISPTDTKFFSTDWISSHPSRFSSRIRAAALALHNQGCFGRFQVSHYDGLLRIKSLNVKRVLYKKVAKSQYTDGVRVNLEFHSEFNPPSSEFYAGKGQSRPITVRFNNKVFQAKYLHENPASSNRDMQSIRFSKELRNEFRNVTPDTTGYFSIKIGPSLKEFAFDIVTADNLTETESFAKMFLQQQQKGILTDNDIDRIRRERLKEFDQNQIGGRQEISNRSVNKSDPILKEDIKQLYRYKCQICSEQIRKVGWAEGLTKQQEFEYLSADAHHVVPLEDHGLDTPGNIICVCPNCHRRLHTWEMIIEFVSGEPVCRNQITGELMSMVVDQDHGFGCQMKK
ncbi:HNH endonuclease signature motif containing protein [Desulfosediminicola ganghwensis]|uniref:HNH endonuclease signature motif containing protein n=1 Tax=Desulfosediminicola ganghwensis TaxID=2569540 RepID=UPI0010AC083B|nr:HNH endonuclease signature motif containing protein [Desulfosediminicola ganghwensis]